MARQRSLPNSSAPIRAGAVLFGLIPAALICALTPVNNILHKATPLGGGHFPLAPFYLLFLLTLITAAGRRLLRAGMARLLPSGAELLVIWMQSVVASGIAYTGLTRTFFLNLTAPFQFASPDNAWETRLLPLLPSWLYPDPAAVEPMYNGLGPDRGWLDILAAIPWQAWARPLCAWLVFILLCYTVMVALVNLFSRQWIHNERLNFPLLGVPELMETALDAGRLGRFLGDPFLLTGLLIPVCLHLLGGLHFYYPSVPQIPTLVLAGPYFPPTGLLSGFIKLKLYFYPAFIGFAFLASRQVSFSFWFFFLAGGLLAGLLPMLGLAVPASALGVTFGPTLSRPEEMQMVGAYGVFFLFLLYLARGHLLATVRQAFRPGPLPTRTEWFDARLSLWICVLGSLAIAAWCVYFGMRPVSALLTVAAFFMITLVASRIICQGGLAYFTLTAAPLDGLLLLFGPGLFSAVGLLVAAVAQKVLFVDLRESLMPSLLHARRVHQDMRERRLLLLGLGATICLAVTVSFVAMLALCYRYGVRELQLEWAVRTTLSVYDNVVRANETPLQPDAWVRGFALAGAVVMGALVVCYHRFPWWPLHPLGYLTAYCSAMRILWLSFFIGWACNALCMRYGGVTLFRRLRLFFIGLILGDFFMAGTWALVGLFADAGYQVLPD